jgi:hypothetical protein
MSRSAKAAVSAAIALALSLPMAADTPAPAAAPSGGGWTPCGEVKDAQSRWECWGGRNGSRDEVMQTTCVPKTACPPEDQHGKPVLNCYYQSSFSTGYRCILFCNYGDAFPWGSDGGNNCK